MKPLNRARQIAPAMFMVALVLALGACGGDYPNSTFNHHTDFNDDLVGLWNKLLFWGTIVFVVVEAILIYTIFRFRKRPNSPPPVMTHGNTALELTWTILPVFILVIIAIPTVKTIWKTEAPAAAGSLEVEVIGHQWWWEFRYPQYKFATANELYLPAGRTIAFTLKTDDVLHSFWVPQLGGKRDLISNRINHIWYTPKAGEPDAVWNGFCTEYCGTSHANMRIHAYTVTPDEFESWAAGQKLPPAFTVAPAAPATPAAGNAKGAMASTARSGATTTVSGGDIATPSATQGTKPATPPGGAPVAAPAQAAGLPPGWTFPADKIPEFAKPKTPYPADLEYNDALLASGDPAKGFAAFNTKGCGGCHIVIPMMMKTAGPNLTHVGSRHTIAGGIFPNDPQHLARWVKNARKMKPGVEMYTFGANEIDPQTKKAPLKGMGGNLTDQEVADIVAYLLALK